MLQNRNVVFSFRRGQGRTRTLAKDLLIGLNGIDCNISDVINFSYGRYTRLADAFNSNFYCSWTSRHNICCFALHLFASIRRFLTSTVAATLLSAFVLSNIDYCNSLLFRSTHDVTSHLYRTQNYAARVILRIPKSSSITIHLKSLDWLPDKVRSTYKMACLWYHCHSSTAPSYVADMLQDKPSHTRSSTYTMPLDLHTVRQHLVIARFFASSSVWNFIPNDFRCSPSLSSSKSHLKTYLFCSVYKDWTLSLITVHMCMAWPCQNFVEGLSYKCINVYKKSQAN